MENKQNTNSTAIFKPLTNKQREQVGAMTVKGFTQVFDPRNIRDYKDVEALCTTSSKFGKRMILAECRALYNLRESGAWTEDKETVAKFNCKNLDDWAKHKLDKERATTQNYCLVGEYVSENGAKDILPRPDNWNMQCDKSYEYAVLLTIIRTAGKGLKGKKVEVKQERQKRIFAIATAGYITPDITSKDKAEKAVIKGLIELFGHKIEEEKPTQNAPEQNAPEQNAPEQNAPEQNAPEQNAPANKYMHADKYPLTYEQFIVINEFLLNLPKKFFEDSETAEATMLKKIIGDALAWFECRPQTLDSVGDSIDFTKVNKV